MAVTSLALAKGPHGQAVECACVRVSICARVRAHGSPCRTEEENRESGHHLGDVAAALGTLSYQMLSALPNQNVVVEMDTGSYKI